MGKRIIRIYFNFWRLSSPFLIQNKKRRNYLRNIINFENISSKKLACLQNLKMNLFRSNFWRFLSVFFWCKKTSIQKAFETKSYSEIGFIFRGRMSDSFGMNVLLKINPVSLQLLALLFIQKHSEKASKQNWLSKEHSPQNYHSFKIWKWILFRFNFGSYFSYKKRRNA